MTGLFSTHWDNRDLPIVPVKFKLQLRRYINTPAKPNLPKVLVVILKTLLIFYDVTTETLP